MDSVVEKVTISHSVERSSLQTLKGSVFVKMRPNGEQNQQDLGSFVDI